MHVHLVLFSVTVLSSFAPQGSPGDEGVDGLVGEQV